MRCAGGRATPRSRRVLTPNARRRASSSRLDRRRLAGRAAPRSAVPLRRCVGGSFQRLRLPLGLRSPAAPAEPDEDHCRVVTEGRQPSCSSMKPSKRPTGERGVHSSSKGGPPEGGRRKCGRRVTTLQSCASHSGGAADETEPPKEGRLGLAPPLRRTLAGAVAARRASRSRQRGCRVPERAGGGGLPRGSPGHR